MITYSSLGIFMIENRILAKISSIGLIFCRFYVTIMFQLAKKLMIHIKDRKFS